MIPSSYKQQFLSIGAISGADFHENISVGEKNAQAAPNLDPYSISIQKIHFENLLTDNYNVQHTVFLEIQEALANKVSVVNFPPYVFQYLVQFGLTGLDEYLLLSLDILSYYCKLPDGECCDFLNEDALNLLLMVIDHDKANILLALSLSCLHAITSPKRKMIAANLSFDSILQHAIHALESIFTREDEYLDEIVSLSFSVIANSLINIELITEIVQIIITLVISFCDQSTENFKCFRTKWFSYSLRTLSFMIYWKKELIPLFLENKIIDRVIRGLDINDFELSNHCCSAIANLSVENNLIGLEFASRGFVGFIPPDGWPVQPIITYIRAMITVINQSRECFELQKGENLQTAKEQIIDQSPQIISYIQNFLVDSTFEIRNPAIILFCSIINMNISSILNMMMNGNLDIIEFLLDDIERKERNNIPILIQSLRTVCLYGDRISQQMGILNPYLSLAIEYNLIDILNDVEETFDSDEELLTLINAFRIEIEHYQMCQEIDSEIDLQIEVSI